jgi:thiamine-monophosphate kinase
MKLKSLEERELISAIRRDFYSSRPGIILGIGDDAAVIKRGRQDLIITKDLLFEDVHFISSLHPPYLLGRKSLNVNLSDIAAMGGEPRYCLLGLGFPSRTSSRWVSEYFSGFKSASEEWGVPLIGGDVSRSKKITISVTVIGESRNIIRRQGAKPGHLLYVSGSLGDAKQGFLLLKKGIKPKQDKRADSLIRAFLDPVPQIRLAREISRRMLASSMIDISDGLSVDLNHLCQESGWGAEVNQEKLPLSTELRFWQKRPLEIALHGGEDYQLLFSVPPENQKSVSGLEKRYRITLIGRMVRKKGIYLITKRGQKKRLEIKGYQHFNGVRPL